MSPFAQRLERSSGRGGCERSNRAIYVSVSFQKMNSQLFARYSAIMRNEHNAWIANNKCSDIIIRLSSGFRRKNWAVAELGKKRKSSITEFATIATSDETDFDRVWPLTCDTKEPNCFLILNLNRNVLNHRKYFLIWRLITTIEFCSNYRGMKSANIYFRET